MSNRSTQNAWYLLSFFPTAAALIVISLIILAFQYQSSDEIAIAYAISFTLSEGMMLASALGILGTLKTKIKTGLIKSMRLLNVAILAGSGYVGYSTFLKMTA